MLISQRMNTKILITSKILIQMAKYLRSFVQIMIFVGQSGPSFGIWLKNTLFYHLMKIKNIAVVDVSNGRYLMMGQAMYFQRIDQKMVHRFL